MKALSDADSLMCSGIKPLKATLLGIAVSIGEKTYSKH